MRKLVLILIISVVIFNCKDTALKTPLHHTTAVNWQPVQNYYSKQMQHAILFLDTLETQGVSGKHTKHYFTKVRQAFKRAEPYAAYLNPQVGHKANGPALPVYKEDNGKILKSNGLQKLEETIYDTHNENDFKREIYVLKGMLNILNANIIHRELNAKRFFISTHQQLLRLVALAMSCFDTPVSKLSIQETATSLESLEHVYLNSIAPIIKAKNIDLHKDFINQIAGAIALAKSNKVPDAFDRYTYIKAHLNPITKHWVAIRKVSGLWQRPSKGHPLNFDAPTFFETNSFNAHYFQTSTSALPSQTEIALGKQLFFEKKLSESGTMSCATCHNPDKAYTDGLQFGLDNTNAKLARNTPTLINSVFQKSFFWDGRSQSITDQITAVFTNTKEFNTDVHRFSNRLLKDSTYTNLFEEIYKNTPKTNKTTIKALSAYVATLYSFNSKFDKNIRGDIDTFTESEKNGFNIFMGKALCATCHFIPLTNGTVPPFYSETEKEVIGVPATNANKTLDDDLGFYWVFGEDLHKGMFKTPSIRNIEHTAPYMHNGVYSTLEEVMNFYNKGGGSGLGFNIEHQTLPFDKLNLTTKEQNDVIAFMKTLNAPLTDY